MMETIWTIEIRRSRHYGAYNLFLSRFLGDIMMVVPVVHVYAMSRITDTFSDVRNILF